MQKMPKRGVKRQVAAAVLKKRRALQQCGRGAEKKIFHSLCQGPKQLKNRPKILCKNWPKREIKRQVIVGDLKQKKTLNQTWR